jgi:scyllo-inositol 2-dehydrogenase (NADP+)
VEGSGTTVRVAIVGYGLAGSVFHAALVATTPGMSVAAIVTADDERRAQARRDHPEARVLDRADAIWADAGAYDLVVVAAPNRAHAPLTLAAIDAGLPVVVDKPMAATPADARAMVDAADRAGLMLTVFHNRRWDSDFLSAQKLLAGGDLGAPVRLESRFDRFRPEPRSGAWRELADPADAGGTLWDLGPHLIDQARVLFGEPTHLYAEVERRRPGALVDDDVFVALRFRGGESAQIWASQVAAIAGPRMRLSGLRGAYEQPGVDPQEDMLRSGMRPGDPGWGLPPRERWGRLVTADPEPGDRTVEPEPGRWEEFYARVRESLLDGSPPPVDPRDGLRAVELIDAARRSAAERAVLRLSA